MQFSVWNDYSVRHSTPKSNKTGLSTKMDSLRIDDLLSEPRPCVVPRDAALENIRQRTRNETDLLRSEYMRQVVEKESIKLKKVWQKRNI